MRRGHVDDGWPYRGLTNSGNSQENVGTSFRSQRLSLAPPSYDDVIIQGRERKRKKEGESRGRDWGKTLKFYV